MQKLLKLPLVFLFLAALIGLLLRWHSFQPISGLLYSNWLHAHSHLMFLGWVFNALSVGFVVSFIPGSDQPRYTKIFITLNVLVLGMLVAFPLQGYGLFSIIISTLHTVVVAVFLYNFFKDTRQIRHPLSVSPQTEMNTRSGISVCGDTNRGAKFFKNTRQVRSESILFVRSAFLFFLISAAGPFIVGALSANGLGHTQWYHQAVYFYLHFQYNGVFTFGIFGLLFHWFEEKGVRFQINDVRIFRVALFVACFPAYVLSTLWADPGMLFNVLGFVAALLQLFALIFLIRSITSWRENGWNHFTGLTRTLLTIAFFSFVLKLFLQMLSAFPFFALLAYDVRNYVMAYLHLVLIGTISFSLLAWYLDHGISMQSWMLGILFLGFAGTELTLGATEFINHEVRALVMVVSSFLLVVGIGSIGWSAVKRT